MKKLRLLFFGMFLLLPAAASAASISFSPADPIQGDPLLISVSATTTVRSITFAGKPLGIFAWKGASSALYGIDLYKKPGAYKVVAMLSDGSRVEKSLTVGARAKESAPLGIPEKLGGNTPAAATTLVSTLAQENQSLLGLHTGDHAFWKAAFREPVADPVVTDTYGYQRQTGGYSIAHKGTDYRALEGTPVLAVARGVVRLTQTGRNYGKTIVVDHGLGVQSLYLHLSKISVQEGQLVLPGQEIGRSGSTGYADRPHLHLSIRIGETSVDPVRFFSVMR
jgi:hypothetical protein